MNNVNQREGRATRQYPNGIYPWRIRPGFQGGGSLRSAYATPTVSATSLNDPTAYVTVDGTPVPLTGDVLPDMSIDQGAHPLVVSIIPQSVSYLVSHSETSRQAFWSGSSQSYLQFYQGGQKIQPATPIGSSYQSGTTRYVAYNYEYGQAILQNYGFYFSQFGGQLWLPPYVPDSVALMAVVNKASVVQTVKVMILWET